MRHLLFAAALVLTTAPVLSADVGVSISIGQPGFYGRLDIGGYPQPPVIYLQPRVIERVLMDRPPIYLRVPPGHAKNWRKHCHKYDACGEPVFFVEDHWYNDVYVPRHLDNRRSPQETHRDKNRKHHEKKRHGEGRGHGRDH